MVNYKVFLFQKYIRETARKVWTKCQFFLMLISKLFIRHSLTDVLHVFSFALIGCIHVTSCEYLAFGRWFYMSYKNEKFYMFATVITPCFRTPFIFGHPLFHRKKKLPSDNMFFGHPLCSDTPLFSPKITIFSIRKHGVITLLVV